MLIFSGIYLILSGFLSDLFTLTFYTYFTNSNAMFVIQSGIIEELYSSGDRRVFCGGGVGGVRMSRSTHRN